MLVLVCSERCYLLFYSGLLRNRERGCSTALYVSFNRILPRRAGYFVASALETSVVC